MRYNISIFNSEIMRSKKVQELCGARTARIYEVPIDATPRTPHRIW